MATAAVTLVAVQAPGATAETTYSAHWTFDETGGSTAYDVSGNGNDGTSSHVVGDGSGYTFNGTDSRVVVPDSPTLRPGSADFSYGVSLTMTQPPAKGETYEVLSKGTAGNKGGNFKIEIKNSSGKAKARCVFNSILPNGKRANAAQLGKASLADGRPHTVTCIKTATGVTTRIDALAAITKTVAGGLGSVTNTAPVGLGAKAQQDSQTS